MEILLGILIVITQLGWLWFVDRLLKRQSNERWELYERIRAPENVIAPPSVIEDAPEPGPILEEKPVDELDLVGRVDPPTPLRED